jgi:hypothetical protein
VSPQRDDLQKIRFMMTLAISTSQGGVVLFEFSFFKELPHIFKYEREGFLDSLKRMGVRDADCFNIDGGFFGISKKFLVHRSIESVFADR